MKFPACSRALALSALALLQFARNSATVRGRSLFGTPKHRNAACICRLEVLCPACAHVRRISAACSRSLLASGVAKFLIMGQDTPYLGIVK